MQYFANYKNGSITVNTYRFIDACVTDFHDILDAHKKASDEVLVASISNDQELKIIMELVAI